MEIGQSCDDNSNKNKIKKEKTQQVTKDNVQKDHPADLQDVWDVSVSKAFISLCLFPLKGVWKNINMHRKSAKG